MPERIVDHLEVIDVKRQHGDPAPGQAPLERRIHFLAEGGPVPQARHRVVGGQVCHSLFHFFAVGHVADVQDERRLTRTVQQVGDRHLAVGPAAQLVPEPAADQDGMRRCRQRPLQAGGIRGPIGRMEEFGERLTDQLGWAVGEEAVDRGTHEADLAIGIGEQHDVTRVLHQGAKVGFTVPQGDGPRFQLLIERLVVPDDDELTDHDEADDDDQVPQQERVRRAADILEHRQDGGNRHRDVGQHERPATKRPVIGLRGRSGGQGRTNRAERDQEIAGDPTGIDDLHLPVGVGRREVSKGAIG